MAKKIAMSDQDADTIIAGIAEKLKQEFTASRHIGAFSYTYKPEEIKLNTKVILDFSALAYLKMQQLIQGHREEIAWHGIVEASEDRKHFYIKDIMVYPQSVTSTSVVTDETKYQTWKNALNDEQYNNLRFQGHSHVNMPSSPSGRDSQMYAEYLDSLGANSYYIFLIVNKRNEYWINIYDIPSNTLYEKSDIILLIEGVDLDVWYTAQIKEYITEYKYITTYQSPAVGAATSGTAAATDEKKTNRRGGTLTTNTRTGDKANTESNGKFQYTAPYERGGQILSLAELDPLYMLDPTADNEALIKKYEQQRKAGKVNYPIYCVGCNNAKKYNPKKGACKVCTVQLAQAKK